MVTLVIISIISMKSIVISNYENYVIEEFMESFALGICCASDPIPHAILISELFGSRNIMIV